VKDHLDVVGLPSEVPSLLGQPGVRQTRMLAIDGLYMNLKRKPFDNVHVRRALTMSLDRPILVSESMGNIVTPFEGNVPPDEMGYDASLKPLPYDPKR